MTEKPNKGRVLLAAQSFRAGQLMLDEAPLLFVAADGTWTARDGSRHTEPPPTQPAALSAATDGSQWTYFCAFRAQQPAAQSAILDGFFAPVDGEKATQLRHLASQCGLTQREVELFVKVSMVFEFNGADVCIPGADGERPTVEMGDAPVGTGIYEVACKMSHSCAPNATWLTGSSTGHKHVRALRPIACGDELTIDYIGNADMMPRLARRRELQATKGFQCECSRCSAATDDTRRFQCVAAAACPSGHHQAKQESPEQPTSFAPCCVCGAVAGAKYVRQMLLAESTTEATLSRILRTVACDSGTLSQEADSKSGDTVADPVSAIEKLSAPHPHHHLAEQVADLQWELSQQQEGTSAAGRAVAACRAKVSCRNAIVGEQTPHRQSAFAWEYLGDALQKQALFLNGRESTETWQEAHAAFMQAAQMLMLTDGPAEPFAACATKKLAAVRKRLHTNGARVGVACDEKTPRRCEFCGVHEAMAPASLRRCGRCKMTMYCCPEHQKAAWPVHKKDCKEDHT